MKSLNILILMDEETMYQKLTELLKKMGFMHIFIAQTHTEAFELASLHQVDIMLSSAKIGEKYDGIDAVKALQKLYNIVVIFICTGRDENLLARVAEVDFIGYLISPFREEELQTLIIIATKKSKLQSDYSSLKTSGRYSFHTETNILYKDGMPRSLTKKERLFFSLFFQNIQIVLPYSLINDTLWTTCTVSDNTRRTFIHRVKQKFPDLNLQIIKHIGYRLE